MTSWQINLLIKVPNFNIIPHQLTMGYQYFIEVPNPPKSKIKHPSNYVSTTKYNILTYLPHSLIIQFRRYANVYFLICAILQSIPLISPLSPFSAVAPLIFVLCLSMAREGYQDYNRWVSDKKSNSSLTHVFRQKNLCNIAWSVIKVGDLVKVYSEELVPVDMIPLYCSNSSGISYVQTSSLDGQKNLKPKISLTDTQIIFNKKNQFFLQKMQCKVFCDAPDADINKFNAKIQLSVGDQKINNELNHKNLILRGTKVKNTEWVVGLAVYTGKNTKIMKNGCSATTKVSNIQRRVNFIILFVLLFEVFCSGISALYCFICCTNSMNFERMVRNGQVDCSQTSGISFGSYFILYSTYIPISLIVSLQFVKLFQGYVMSKDPEMYCSINDRSMQCHTVSINEQLGQIQYILTDKTGTLTCNRMQFKNVIVGTHVYGEDIKLLQIDKQFDYSRIARKTSMIKLPKMDSKKFKNQQPLYKPFDARGISYQLSNNQQQQKPKMMSEISQKEQVMEKTKSKRESKNQSSDHKKEIQLIFFIITTCHQCLKQSKPDKGAVNRTQSVQSENSNHKNSQKQQVSYQGPSPDQVALLNAAKKIGFQFMNTQNKVTTVKYNGKQIKFKILKIVQFDSDRKRMSVAVEFDGQVMVFVKGADTSIKKLLTPNQIYLQFLVQKTRDMAKTGLRSLWYGYKTMPKETDFQAISVQDMEKDISLIGATGIEDRLQDFVPQTIYSLRQGGIKFIMLTGDKLETAQNIARSCKMIEEAFLVDNSNKLAEGIKFIKDAKSIGNNLVCPVIDGSVLDFVTFEKQLLQIIQISTSAVFCRVTPNQKAQIVKIVKKLGKLTLAIGDGANDVNMILEAHVGVGIFGQEGTRAAQVANYAIGQFCLIWKLLLYYGRLNYMRIAEMILYFFYKNMVFTIVQFAYSFYNQGSGQSFWLSWSITFYNMIFTLFPVVIRAVFQVDVEVASNKKTLKQLSDGTNDNTVLYSYYPKMYIISQKNQIFTNVLFIQWFSLGILQGIICLLITIYGLGGVTVTSGFNSYGSGFYFAELSGYTSVIVVVTMKIALNIRHWNCILVISFLIPSLGAYFVFCFVQNSVQFSFLQDYFSDMLQMPAFYLVSILVILGMFSMDLFLFSLEATRNNFQNYFKKRAMTGRRMTEANLHELISRLQTNSIYESEKISSK